MEWLEECRDRLGQHAAPNGKKRLLHKGFGYMTKAVPHIAKRTIGGSPPSHKKACQCPGCQEWRKVYDEDSARGARPTRR